MKRFIIIILTVVFAASANHAAAQGLFKASDEGKKETSSEVTDEKPVLKGPPDGDAEVPFDPYNPSSPVGEGIAILAVLGGVYGFVQRKKNLKENN